MTLLTAIALVGAHAWAVQAVDGMITTNMTDYVSWGAGPRASQYLVLGAKARAVLHGRYYVSCEDIRAVAAPVLIVLPMGAFHSLQRERDDGTLFSDHEVRERLRAKGFQNPTLEWMACTVEERRLTSSAAILNFSSFTTF